MGREANRGDSIIKTISHGSTGMISINYKEGVGLIILAVNGSLKGWDAIFI